MVKVYRLASGKRPGDLVRSKLVMLCGNTGTACNLIKMVGWGWLNEDSSLVAIGLGGQRWLLEKC